MKRPWAFSSTHLCNGIAVVLINLYRFLEFNYLPVATQHCTAALPFKPTDARWHFRVYSKFVSSAVVSIPYHRTTGTFLLCLYSRRFAIILSTGCLPTTVNYLFILPPRPTPALDIGVSETFTLSLLSRRCWRQRYCCCCCRPPGASDPCSSP